MSGRANLTAWVGIEAGQLPNQIEPANSSLEGVVGPIKIKQTTPPWRIYSE